MNNSKIIDLQAVTSAALSHLQKRVLVGGCFDIFHYGHLTFLKKSRAVGESLIVMLEPDEFIRDRKKRIPFHVVEKRASILAELECVDLVVILPVLKSFDEYLQVVQRIRPSVIALTEGDSQLENKKRHAMEVGATVEIVPLLPKFSSTKAYDAVITRN